MAAVPLAMAAGVGLATLGGVLAAKRREQEFGDLGHQVSQATRDIGENIKRAAIRNAILFPGLSQAQDRVIQSVQLPGGRQIESPTQTPPEPQFRPDLPQSETQQQVGRFEFPLEQLEQQEVFEQLPFEQASGLTTQLPLEEAQFDPVIRSEVERPESGFFTKTEKAIEGAQKVMTAQQAQALISKQGKKDDIDQEALGQFLKENPKVTRDQLSEFVKGNQTRVETTVRGGGVPFSSETSQGTLTGTTIDDTKYSQFQLPGGENYQETLFRLPETGRTSGFAVVDRLSGEVIKEFDDKEDALRKVLQTRDTSLRDFKERNTFTSHAFDEPNTFGWMRTNERQTSEGDNVLFVEEAQKVNSQADNISEEQLRALPQFARNGFTEFSVKQMIEKAVAEGKDVVAWTTGEQQAERYDLSKQLDNLNVFRNENGIFEVRGTAKDSDVREDSLFKDQVLQEELPNIIGKELADKVIKSGKEENSFTGIDLKVGGESLKQFYDRNLPSTADKYIKKLDKDAKVEEFDIGQGEKISVQRLKELKQEIKDNTQKAIEGNISILEEERRNQKIRDMIESGAKSQKGFRITPKMREKVLKEGQPLSSIHTDSSEVTVDAGTFAAV